MIDWAHGWWPGAIAAGAAPCTRCGADVRVVPYERPERLDPHTRRGWHARRPGARAVPTRKTEHAGRSALVVALRDDGSGDEVAGLFDDATARPLGVVATV